ncbi:hypothetical protein K439DRAFT_1614377 [Ramaria rubella]|nr:hypothetical protein K439DRAFT_1614377 [Ramaria rubella]
MVDASDTLSSCRSNVPGEGCGGDFPRKLTAGLCARCAHLETLARDEIKYEQFVLFEQCLDRHVVLAEMPEIGRRVKWGKQSQTKSKNDPMHSTHVSHVMASGASREAIVTVCMDVRHKGKIASAFGATTRSMAESVSITELHADAVSFVNKYWEKMHDQSLMQEDTELRWHGNQPPEDNTDLMSIGEFFQMHYALPHASIYFDNVPKQYAKIKGKHICLELWISEDSSLRLIQMQDERRGNPNTHGQSWRRVISQNAHEYVTSGVLLASGPMESSFVFAKRPALAPTESKDHVQLQLAKCVVVDQTGEVEIEWEHGTIPVEGDLARKLLARGKTKRVYTLNMNDKAYVAK